ncbi:MAG TPA: Glu/Leu/Phe/Val dehydrogenase dimerization domain-containing protein [Gammaproteobacteria bacterium]
MSVRNHPEFDHHEEVVFFDEPSVGLKAIVAIHNTRRGPALGGCRMYPYESEDAALNDVLRLSKGMTYKSAISGLPLGGGKSVIIGDPQRDKSTALFEAFGRCLERLDGRYIVAEDSGTSVEDLHIIATQTRHVSGVGERQMPDGGVADGDPSPATAYGVLTGIQAAIRHGLGRDDLRGVGVAVQGVGSVGRRLVEHLRTAGARVTVTDVFRDRSRAVAAELGVTEVEPEAIYGAEVDVFAPCALGGILNDETIPRLKARIVAGAANNQLWRPEHGERLHTLGICYVPDFAINAGGVIDIAGYQAGLSYAESLEQVGRIGGTITEILRRARAENRPTAQVALEMAQENLR